MRKLSIFLAMVLILTMLAGCGSGNDGPVKSIPLPENGIVPKAELVSAAKNGTVLYVSGNSGEFDYQWAIFGSKINEPTDVDMSASIVRAGAGEYSVTLSESLEFMPSFSFRIPEKYDAETVGVCDSDGSLLCEASVSTYSDGTDVCFYVLPEKTVYDISFHTIPGSESTAAGKAEESGKTENGLPEADGEKAEESSGTQAGAYGNDTYLSSVSNGEELKTASSSSGKYNTDPIPEGKPQPVEPEDRTVTDISCSCTISISCATILNNMDMCNPDKVELVPSDGWILRPVTVTFNQGESVFDVLQRVCRNHGIHMEFEWTPMYNSAYIEGIHNLYEFDVGNLSGWMYKVNGWFPNYGCSRYALQDGDTVVWCYTCDLGYDVGGGYAVGG